MASRRRPNPGRKSGFQSPSRGGHLRGIVKMRAKRGLKSGFSPLREGDTSVAGEEVTEPRQFFTFQSPSRGGHLRGPQRRKVQMNVNRFQSPSRGGHLRGNFRDSTWKRFSVRFSPLREGDTSVAFPQALQPAPRLLVSVPFARGTPPWQ